ncbi:MAG: hypothetical protein LLF96_00245 [Eubacteriales bacterium]|nr:hypothetical protein [Eubacteriales bacterium]
MPLINYCSHCKVEVSSMGVCPRCGKRLTKASERLSFKVERKPVADWFSWNAVLRVAVPALLLVLIWAVLFAAVTEGEAGVSNLLRQGLPGTLLAILLLLLAVICLLLALQGRETVRYVLDREGAHAITYLRAPGTVRLWARLTTKKALETLQADAPDPKPEGLVYLRRADLRWSQVRRAQFWPQTHTALLYRPSWWQTMVIRCDEAEYAQAEAWISAKVSRKRRLKTGRAKKGGK